MKKLVSSLLTLSMLCGMSAQAFADVSADNADKILDSVKNRISVSSDYDAFLSDSYTDDNGTEYTFSWESEDKSINVTANESGIISSYLYTDNTEPDNQKPSIKETSWDVLYKAACAYVQQLNPGIYGKLKITGGTNTESLTNDSYYFDIQRYENNIPIEGNGGYIAVSSDGKTLKDFSLTYTTGVEFEKADKIISRDAAQKAYTDKIGFNLCYGSNYADGKISAFPIYTTNDEYMKYISATSGKPIKLNDISYVYESTQDEKQGAVPYPEAQEEYTAANELKGIAGILSEKQAEATVRANKIINIPKNYALRSISGFADCDNENRYFYTLLFVGAKNSDYAEVMLDAKSGEIVNFNKTQNEGKNVITNEKAKEIAKNALASLAPKHINDYILSYVGENGVFSFTRNVNGIEFPANQINIYVDMTNGNVVWYDYSYSDIKFPSLEKVIPTDKISKVFFENSDFSPVYVLNCSKPGMTRCDRATLVYKFSNSDVTEFDAITGKPMWDNSDESLRAYSDISKIPAENAINTLRRYGIMYDSDNFMPDKEITQKEFIALITSILYEKCSVTLSDDFDYSYEYKQAKRAGIITDEEYAPESKVTKESAALFLARALNINEYAELKGLYNCPFNDVKTHIGQISILNAMNVLTGDENGNYNPQNTLSRADCAVLLYNYLSR